MKIVFLGGDLRQKYASDYLLKKEYDSKVYLDFDIEKIENEIREAKILALPIPVSIDSIHLKTSEGNIFLDDIIEIAKSDSIILGGRFANKTKDKYAQNRVIIDYMDIEPFQIQNALLSAEGAIHYAKQKFDKSIHGANIAIFGCGRIGKILAYLLRSQGATVTVLARCDINLTWSKLIGLNTLKISAKNKLFTKKYDIIFNTIPHRIMDEEFVRSTDPMTIIIDLASFPYGMDDKLAKEYNLKYYRELGIPGRYAPVSAGEIIAKTIINNILTREDLI
ncbi:MAG: hypothetical protein IKA84_02465 [Clostridia bacterium]|nr:hypothetical protein [Clostridia bacterium]